MSALAAKAAGSTPANPPNEVGATLHNMREKYQKTLSEKDKLRDQIDTEMYELRVAIDAIDASLNVLAAQGPKTGNSDIVRRAI